MQKISAALALPALLIFFACTDPVFYTISQEVRATDARIKGTPTNIVNFDGYVYVASNVLFRYDGNANPLLRWQVVPSPPGQKINHLAATHDYLYVLCSSGSGPGSTTLYRHEAPFTGLNWEPVNSAALSASGYPYLFSIYADDRQDSTQLFAGAWNGNGESDSPTNYAIFWADENSNSLKTLITGSGGLSGAAFDGTNHFIATGYGIYVTNNSTPITVLEILGLGNNFPGIIQLNNETVTVNRGGYLYTVTASMINPTYARVGYLATGALAAWYDPDPASTDPNPKLLLVGIQGSSGSSNYGYREMVLSGGDLSTATDTYPYVPGSHSPTSVFSMNSARYETTLGHRPVNYLFQVPDTVDPERTLFAATVKDGLFSYRLRDGDWQWNAEE
jgi:hypothetical protein